MTIECLKQLLPPPKMPLETGSQEGWDQVERELGTVLSTDYKCFIATYGTGAINRFLWVYNPFSTDQYLNLFTQAKAIGSAYMETHQKFPEDFPYQVFPDAGGLLAWAGTGNGDAVYWLTEGNPDRWPIVVYGPRACEHEIYHQPVTDFLCDLVSKRLCRSMFPDDFPEGQPRFERIDEFIQGYSSES